MTSLPLLTLNRGPGTGPAAFLKVVARDNGGHVKVSSCDWLATEDLSEAVSDGSDLDGVDDGVDEAVDESHAADVDHEVPLLH